MIATDITPGDTCVDIRGDVLYTVTKVDLVEVDWPGEGLIQMVRATAKHPNKPLPQMHYFRTDAAVPSLRKAGTRP